jgi:uncharacterized protein YndB with AHSA1/START domain
MARDDYDFTSVWTIAASRGDTWAFLEAPDQRWADWWPGLRSVDLDRTDGLLGSTARCRWRSPWGYRVGVDLRVESIDPARRVDLVADGDLVGRGRVIFDDLADGGTRVTTHWHVATTPGWMRLLAPVLRPVFSFGHHVVMRRGERGLDRALRRSNTSSTSVDRTADRP